MTTLQKIKRKVKKFMKRHKHLVKNGAFIVAGLGVITLGIFFIWISTVHLPDFTAFEERKLASSTKIYDRTGTVVLYNVNENFRRTVVPFDAMGLNIKNATIAIEDDQFYSHHGIRPLSIARAILANISTGEFTQGGSTITQQVVKNTLLTQRKTISRKLKEWILAVKVENRLSKNEILEIYLNQSSYGGNIYGIEEASHAYFKKPARELSLAEAAYLASIPRGPSLYSPFGNHRDKLEERKNFVLYRMHHLDMITDEEYATAKSEVVNFSTDARTGIKAPHFVFYILDYLEQKYGEEAITDGGLKVITTLDYELQEAAEKTATDFAERNKKGFNASNSSIVAIDPKTGQILTMVGSRDYFAKDIDGNFNVATALRQPGSSFKPIVYVTGFNMGYTPETILYDIYTEFNPSCSTGGQGVNCYHPMDYNDKFRGPMTLRNALQQSINVPAVKMLYLVGIDNALKTARDLGITSLTHPDRYGLALVLGGGEVSLLEMTGAYGVFAAEGVRHPSQSILRIDDPSGNILEEFEDHPTEVLPRNTVLTLTSVLTDNTARIPTFGANSPMFFPDRPVAAKTGTTNNTKDVWVIGYTPSLVVGAWIGNNDNTPMRTMQESPTATRMWRNFMDQALKKYPVEDFPAPDPDPEAANLKPVLRGDWQGAGAHSILYWVDKTNPRGSIPSNPAADPQYKNWNAAVQAWWGTNGVITPTPTDPNAPVDPNNPNPTPTTGGVTLPGGGGGTIIIPGGPIVE